MRTCHVSSRLVTPTWELSESPATHHEHIESNQLLAYLELSLPLAAEVERAGNRGLRGDRHPLGVDGARNPLPFTGPLEQEQGVLAAGVGTSPDHNVSVGIDDFAHPIPVAAPPDSLAVRGGAVEGLVRAPDDAVHAPSGEGFELRAPVERRRRPGI